MSKDKTVPKNISKRTVTRSLYIPYGEGDEEVGKFLDEMINARKEANLLEEQIAPLKEKMRESQKAADEARDKIFKGKPVNVEVEEIFNYDEGMVHAMRLDTKEKLSSREMTPDDYQTDIIDETPPETHEKGKTKK